MACSKLSPQEVKKYVEWDTSSLFWCGEYYFDGEYNVVRFPAGVSFYHGSSGLAKSMTPFPVGFEYFKQKQNGNFRDPSLTIQAQISKKMKNFIEPGWYGSFQTAQTYSSQTDRGGECGTTCLLAYKTTRPITILLFNDPKNLLRLRDKSSNRELFTHHLGKIFTKYGTGSYNAVETGFDDPLRSLDLTGIYRYSTREYDLPIAQEIRRIIGNDYDGYGAPPMRYNDKSYFHDEIIIFNPFDILERDIKNPRDRYYFPNTGIDSVDKYIKSSSLFESTNVDFHAGNLIEHSVWALLWAESLCVELFLGKSPIEKCPNSEGFLKCLNESPVGVETFTKMVSAIAFLHDSTKMKDYQSMLINNTRKKFLYFSVPDHPMRDVMTFPLFDENLNKTGDFSSLKLLYDMVPEYSSATPEQRKIFGENMLNYISFYHRDFGIEVLQKFYQGGEPIENLVRNFVKKHFSPKYSSSPRIFLLALLIVSWADIAATQPYGIFPKDGSRVPIPGAVLASRFFPYIKNMTRVYSGGQEDINLRIFDLDAIRKIFDLMITEVDRLARM